MDAVVVVLAEVRDLPRERAGRADLDRDRFLGGRRGRRGRFGLRGRRLLRFFLAAAVDADDRGGDERQADVSRDLHGVSPRVK
jgi:hypothetical protein